MSWRGGKRGAGAGRGGGRGGFTAHAHGRDSSKDSAAKKPKIEQESQEDADDMDVDMDDLNAGFFDEAMEDETGPVVGQEEDTATAITYAEWDRPEVRPDFDAKKDPIIFQQFDVDHYLSNTVLPAMPGAKIGPVPVLR